MAPRHPSSIVIVRCLIQKIRDAKQYQVGGSLSGLMHGIMLRSLGHNVRILERAPDSRESYMAGVCLGSDSIEFLRRYDRTGEPFTFESERLQVFDQKANITHFFRAHRRVTSWDAFYYRLRANFDSLKSRHYPVPPQRHHEDGESLYESNKEVTSVHVDEGGAVVVYSDVASNKPHKIRCDLVICADGPNSTVRRAYLPNIRRQYAGFIGWRGTVQEDAVSEYTRRAFHKNVTLNLMRQNHALVQVQQHPRGSMS